MAGLDKNESELWDAWKGAAEKVRGKVRGKVAADITAKTGLSDPDFGVLTRLVELGDGKLRQSDLARSMGWHRSRLSHHLTRMEQRELLRRRDSPDGGVEVEVTSAGRSAAVAARPVHAAAVRRHLIEPLSGRERDSLRAILDHLSDPN
jgi:DNA-binding MarR family transcriptional regulator